MHRLLRPDRTRRGRRAQGLHQNRGLLSALQQPAREMHMLLGSPHSAITLRRLALQARLTTKQIAEKDGDAVIPAPVQSWISVHRGEQHGKSAGCTGKALPRKPPGVPGCTPGASRLPQKTCANQKTQNGSGNYRRSRPVGLAEVSRAALRARINQPTAALKTAGEERCTK